MCEKRRFFLVEGLPAFQSKRTRQIKLDQKRLTDYGIKVEDNNDKDI